MLHGGDNTLVKTTATDLLEEVEVLCVKGSGADMGTIGPEGLPAVRLVPLRRLHTRTALSNEAMVNFQHIHLLDTRSRPIPRCGWCGYLAIARSERGHPRPLFAY
ncbi:hypothetical protein CCP3SC1_290003 [Gammaproteobacteria bacterium]